MNVRSKIALFAAAGPSLPKGPIKAPERFRIWRPGNNPGDYGDSILTPSAAERVMAEYLNRGNPLGIDIEHNTNPRANPDYDPANPPPTGGYACLTLVDTPAGPELWADPVRWSEYARQQIESGERCCISPDWELDLETREPIQLNKVSLVFEPGTWGIGLLASRSAGKVGVKNMDLEKLKAMIQGVQELAETAEDQDLKTMATEFAAKLTEAAKALGIDPSAETAPATEDTSTGGAQEETPMAQAVEEEKPMVAVAAKGLTTEDVLKLVREEQVKQGLIASARTSRVGVTDELATLLAMKPLSQVKSILAALPKAPKQVEGGPVPPAPVIASKQAGMNDEERKEIERLDRQTGIAASRAEETKKKLDRQGGLAVSVTALRTARQRTQNA